MITNELSALIVKNMANQMRQEIFNSKYEPDQSELQCVCQVQTIKPQRRMGLLSWVSQRSRQPQTH